MMSQRKIHTEKDDGIKVVDLLTLTTSRVTQSERRTLVDVAKKRNAESVCKRDDHNNKWNFIKWNMSFFCLSLILFLVPSFLLQQIIMIINSNLIRSMNFKWGNIALLHACLCIAWNAVNRPPFHFLLRYFSLSTRHSTQRQKLIYTCVYVCVNGSFDEITNHL